VKCDQSKPKKNYSKTQWAKTNPKCEACTITPSKGTKPPPRQEPPQRQEPPPRQVPPPQQTGSIMVPPGESIMIQSVITIPQQQFQILIAEREKLFMDNELLKKENKDLLYQLAEQGKEINLLKEVTTSLSRDNNRLETEIENLKKDNDILKKTNANLKQELDIMKKDITELKDKISKVEIPLSLREAMRALENYCVLEIIGSKSQMIKSSAFTLFDVEKLAKNNFDVADKLKKFNKLSSKDISYLRFFKKNGDNCAHGDLSSLSANQLFDPQEDEMECQQSKQKMLLLLETYCKEAKKTLWDLSYR